MTPSNMQRDRKKTLWNKPSSSNVFWNVQFRQRWTKFKNIVKKTKYFSKMTADGGKDNSLCLHLTSTLSNFSWPWTIAVTTSGIRMTYFIWCLSSGRVLVHCLYGVSRSVTCVLAYLMIKQGLTLKEAVRQVVQRRAIARPNDGFLYQLLALEKKLTRDT